MNPNLVIVKLKNGQLENIYTDLDLEVVLIDSKEEEVDVHHLAILSLPCTTQEDRELVTACCAINNEEAMAFLNEIAERDQEDIFCDEHEQLVRRTL